MANLFDTTNIRTGEPSEIIAGDLTRWRRTDLSNIYDPTLFTLKYSARLAGSTAREIEITATSDATGFYVDEDAATSAAWQRGVYHWQAYITRNADSARLSVDSGRWTIYRNMDVESSDPRSHAEKMVELLEAALENRAGSDIIYYMIGGRAVSKIPPKELRSLLADYRLELAGEIDAERRSRGMSSRNIIDVRFID